ncbi:MAG: single-stranded-DNA-specific exonuclease RecJ [Clostridia bacterium]|nr:single-stranded-DNA-specific exonuclease RecJ [Clostridia bacterium]
MSFKRWVLPAIDREAASRLAEEAELPAFLALLLSIRHIATAAEANEFLYDDVPQTDPFALVDMEQAVARIQLALARGEKIAVYGDYDVDGITATVLLYSYLKGLGADVMYYIPKREGEGYGLHNASIDNLRAQGCALLITVDNGISAVDEVAYAAAQGVDVVITDHHQPKEQLPAAVAVVDPHRADCPSPFKQYAGVGVAFLLACALEGDMDPVLDAYGDLVALGTLADVMPLIGDNRTLVRAGLRSLNAGKRLGLVKLAHVTGAAGKPITSLSAVYTLAPRLNAAGRMHDPAQAAALLMSTQAEEADQLAMNIQQSNTDRQDVEADILAQAMHILEQDPSLLADRVLVIAGRDWHHGVTGILAARLTDKFGKPCIVISVGDAKTKGSGRSINGFSLFDAVSACSDCLLSFGGHELAAGLTLLPEQIEPFRRRINAYAALHYPQMPVPELLLDCKLRPEQIDLEKLELISRLEPFGIGNPSPLFGLFDMRIEQISPVSNGRHVRLTVSRGATRLNAMLFGTPAASFFFRVGDTVHMIVQLDRSEYQGQLSLLIKVRDIRLADTHQEDVITAGQELDCLLRQERDLLPPRPEHVPSRERLGLLYRTLQKGAGFVGSPEFLLRQTDPHMTYTQLFVALEVLRQGGLLTCLNEGNLLTVRLCPVQGKADLSATPLMRYLTECVKEGAF